MDFDYKKYSLEKLEEWMHDSLSCAEASPQEIYDTIKKVVEENYVYYKDHTGRCYELLALLNGNGRGHIEAYDDYVDSKSNLKCDKDDQSPECQGAWNDFWDDKEHSKYYYEYDRNDPDKPNPFNDKVKRWVLPVESNSSEEYFVSFPDDLLEAANLKEGDQVEWVDQGDGSYLLKKVESNSVFYHPV
jgi:hypothetical protein